jgi:hypothetical protein
MRMLSSDTRLHTNDAEVTATVIDGEAIMINLSSGVYYSTDGVGARIWQLVAGGATLPEVSGIIATEYEIPQAQASEESLRLVNQFVEEKLLLPYTYATVPESPVAEPVQTPFITPQLEIYREMGHLLALDPPMPGLENITWDEPRHA